MASVVRSVDVDAPISAVYDQWTQFESFPQFMGGVDQITQSDDTHTHWVTSIGGVSREFDTEVTEQHPDERIAWKSTDGTTHAGVITFHRLGETSTKVAAQIAWQPDGVEKAGAVLGFDDRQVQSDLDRFKDFIESRGSATGAWRGDVQAGIMSPARPACTLVQIASWVALLAVPAVMVQRARRRRAHHALAGAGDDKAPGYENPSSDDIAHHD